MDYSLFKDEELVALCKKNNSKAFAALTERYISVSKMYADRFSQAVLEKDDLTQEGMLGFMAAVFAFDENQSASFSTFAGCCIKNRILTSVRNASSKKRIPPLLTVSLDAQQDSASNEKNPEESFISQAEAERIVNIIKQELSEKERSVFSLFIQGLSYERIAEKCGCSYKSVDGTLQRVRKKLREKLN